MEKNHMKFDDEAASSFLHGRGFHLARSVSQWWWIDLSKCRTYYDKFLMCQPIDDTSLARYDAASITTVSGRLPRCTPRITARTHIPALLPLCVRENVRFKTHSKKRILGLSLFQWYKISHSMVNAFYGLVLALKKRVYSTLFGLVFLVA